MLALLTQSGHRRALPVILCKECKKPIKDAARAIVIYGIGAALQEAGHLHNGHVYHKNCQPQGEALAGTAFMQLEEFVVKVYDSLRGTSTMWRGKPKPPKKKRR